MPLQFQFYFEDEGRRRKHFTLISTAFSLEFFSVFTINALRVSWLMRSFRFTTFIQNHLNFNKTHTR